MYYRCKLTPEDYISREDLTRYLLLKVLHSSSFILVASVYYGRQLML